MTAPSQRAPRIHLPSGRAADAAVLLGLLVLAAVLRLPDLATRGPWDADQGEQMLAIRSIVGGELTLLGPPTSTGGLRHGPVFYYLGALFAAPTGGDDPTAVTLGIALGGIAAVGIVWWIARAAGGAVAGLVAGLLAAVSMHLVDASVRLWNPAFVAPAAALATAGAVEAWRRRDPRWWIVAAVGVVLAGQSHVLAWIVVVPVGIVALADLRRTGRRAVPWMAAGAGLVALSFLPLAAHELTTGFSELRAMLEARADGGEEGPSLVARLLFVPMRVAGVPLLGDIGQSLMLLPAAAAAVLGMTLLAARRRADASHPDAPRAAVLLACGLLVGSLVLAVGAPWLSTITPLYVDHYHLALDPLVFVIAGLGAAALARTTIGRGVAAVLVAVVVAWNLLVVPLPAVNPDGGWPAGLHAGERVVSSTGGRPTAIAGVPRFKKTMAVDYPVTILGYAPAESAAATRVAVLCDELFEEVVGAACLGPAEEERLAELGIAPGPLLDRFEAAPGRWISIYEIAGR